MSGAAAPQTIHATCIAFEGRGLVILGPSGSGKSALALQLMGSGAQLVADDRTSIWAENDALWAKAPPGLPPLIEARGVGLLRVPVLHGPVRLQLAVEMGRDETERLPPLRHHTACGLSLPLVFRACGPHFPSALLQLLQHGRHA